MKMWWIVLIYSFFILRTGFCLEETQLSITAREGKGWGWGSEDSKFFEIALTALAFLSFGIFLLNLLLNALLFPGVATTTQLTNPDPILTMITGGTTGGAIITGRSLSDNPKRLRRAIYSPEVDPATSSQVLISFITNSIETMAAKHECVPRLLCEGNRQSRVMGKGFQILFPVVSFAITYIGKLFGYHDDLQGQMDAIVLGASEANCMRNFPKC